MTSINTNTSAMTALQSLSMINSNLDETQNRISTGFRVGAASDNAAYWSIATTMRSDNKALGAVEDALGLVDERLRVLALTGVGVDPDLDLALLVVGQLHELHGAGLIEFESEVNGLNFSRARGDFKDHIVIGDLSLRKRELNP